MKLSITNDEYTIEIVGANAKHSLGDSGLAGLLACFQDFTNVARVQDLQCAKDPTEQGSFLYHIRTHAPARVVNSSLKPGRPVWDETDKEWKRSGGEWPLLPSTFSSTEIHWHEEMVKQIEVCYNQWKLESLTVTRKIV